MTFGYSDIFRTTRAWNLELRDPVKMAWMRANGYLWIRVLHRRWEHSVRQPTIGCIVELSVGQYPGSVPIDSVAGRRIINRLCWP